MAWSQDKPPATRQSCPIRRRHREAAPHRRRLPVGGYRYSVFILPQVEERVGVSVQELGALGVGAQPFPCGSVAPVYGFSESKISHVPDPSGERPVARSAAASWLLNV